MLTTHLHLLPRLNIKVVISPLHQYDFMALIGKMLPFTFTPNRRQIFHQSTWCNIPEDLNLQTHRVFCYVVYGSTVVKVLCYKSEGSWFDPSWCHWNFSLT